ncbi:MAG: efflux RND transporter periplasmic adaptor subunit [Phycisphaerae bacterium]
MSRPVFNMKMLLGLIMVLGISTGGWFGYQRLWAAPAGPQFRTTDVTRATIIAKVSATGTVEPLVTVLVGSQVSGTIERWHADFNQQIEEDFVLAELDPERFQRALDQQTAAVAVAKANEEQARVRHQNTIRDFERIERLFGSSNASEDEMRDARALVDEMRAALQAASAQVEVAEAERKTAAVDLSRTVIRSPMSGVVISRDVDEGQTVAASLQTPQLFSIAADLKKMQVHANVSETDVGRILEGMAAEFHVDAYPGREFTGAVSQVRFNPTIVDGVVTYVTLIDVSNDDLALRPGMTATIAFLVDRADDVLTVANAALRFNPDAGTVRRSRGAAGGMFGPSRKQSTPTVYALPNNQAVAIPVAVGLSDGTRSEISGKGIVEGMPVIIEQLFDAAGGSGRPARAMRSVR